MSPSKIKKDVVVQRIQWTQNMIKAINELPLDSKESFAGNKHNIAAAESYLRRALEAVLDLGRHILAKGFAYPATEYKEIAEGLYKNQILDENYTMIMRKIAGYRNRMVHFYNEISEDELFEICSKNMNDLSTIIDKLSEWLRNNSDKIDHNFHN